MVRNTEDFLEQEEVDIHGLSNLAQHKLVMFKYPKSKYFQIIIVDMDTVYCKDYKALVGNKLKPNTRFGDSGQWFNLNKERKSIITANKIASNTTNRDTFSDFIVVPSHGFNRRSNSVAQLPHNKTIVTMEKYHKNSNDSKEFLRTLSFSSPFFNKSSYQNNFQNFGPGKILKFII